MKNLIERCCKTPFHVQFIHYKVQTGISDELQATSNNLQSVDKLTRNGTRMKRMKRLTGNFVTVEMQQSCVEKLKG